jgi:hypothetical protein
MEMKCIFNIGKNMSILAKVTQVSDVAHGPLVFLKKSKHYQLKNLIRKLFTIMFYADRFSLQIYPERQTFLVSEFRFLVLWILYTNQNNTTGE